MDVCPPACARGMAFTAPGAGVAVSRSVGEATVLTATGDKGEYAGGWM